MRTDSHAGRYDQRQHGDDAEPHRSVQQELHTLCLLAVQVPAEEIGWSLRTTIIDHFADDACAIELTSAARTVWSSACIGAGPAKPHEHHKQGSCHTQ